MEFEEPGYFSSNDIEKRETADVQDVSLRGTAEEYQRDQMFTAKDDSEEANTVEDISISEEFKDESIHEELKDESIHEEFKEESLHEEFKEESRHESLADNKYETEISTDIKPKSPDENMYPSFISTSPSDNKPIKTGKAADKNIKKEKKLNEIENTSKSTDNEKDERISSPYNHLRIT
jgi:hypothetical protein